MITLVSGIAENHECPRLPRTRCTFNKQFITCLIDTAATANFIHSRVLTEAQRLTIHPHDLELELAVPGTDLKVQGKIDVTLLLGKNRINISCLVSEELRENLILGLPWIYDEKVVMDISNGRLYAGRD